eukprot:13905092-Ditylum_brightwellii.AAC.1
MERCMALVKRFSNDIGMSFRLDKCAILTIVNGKHVETTILDDFPQLPHDEGYKYLGILESLNFHTKEVKITATKAYISCVRTIW